MVSCDCNNSSKTPGSSSGMGHVALKYPAQSTPAHESTPGITGSPLWRSGLLVFLALHRQVSVVLWRRCQRVVLCSSTSPGNRAVSLGAAELQDRRSLEA